MAVQVQIHLKLTHLFFGLSPLYVSDNFVRKIVSYPICVGSDPIHGQKQRRRIQFLLNSERQLLLKEDSELRFSIFCLRPHGS